MLDDLTTFDFEEQAVRVVMREGEPWFVAADVCRVLVLTNPTVATSGLDDDERHVIDPKEFLGSSVAGGGAQRMTIISESGLFALIFTSRKPEAKRFRKWVTSVVLPAIRKHGFYMHSASGGAGGADPGDFAGSACPPGSGGHSGSGGLGDQPIRDVSVWLAMVREARLLAGRAAALRIWADSPMPPLEASLVKPEDTGVVIPFLTACCAVTGDPEDRIQSTAMYEAFRAWQGRVGAVPLPPRAFFTRMNAAILSWRCPETGARIGKVKRSEQFYTGVVLVE